MPINRRIWKRSTAFFTIPYILSTVPIMRRPNWAPVGMDRSRWADSLLSHTTWVACESGCIIGFGDLAEGGYLDRLYVHKDFVRRGVASALLKRLEASAACQGCGRVYTEASITARPFFEHWGYRVVKRQEKPLRGQVFLNFVMEKML